MLLLSIPLLSRRATGTSLIRQRRVAAWRSSPNSSVASSRRSAGASRGARRKRGDHQHRTSSSGGLKVSRCPGGIFMTSRNTVPGLTT